MSVVNNVNTMNASELPVKPNIKPSEMIHVTLNFENFKKYIDYLEETLKKQNDEIKDLSIKFSRYDEIEHLTKTLTEKVDTLENKFSNIEETLFSHSNKFMEIEFNNNSFKEKVNSQVESLENKVYACEKNLGRLDDSNEDMKSDIYNIKTTIDTLAPIDMVNEKTQSLNNIINTFKEETETRLRELNVSAFKFDNYFEKVFNKIEEMSETIKNLNPNKIEYEMSKEKDQNSKKETISLHDDVINKLDERTQSEFYRTKEKEFKTITPKEERKDFIFNEVERRRESNDIQPNKNETNQNKLEIISEYDNSYNRNSIEQLKKEIVVIKQSQQSRDMDYKTQFTELRSYIDMMRSDEPKSMDDNRVYTRKNTSMNMKETNEIKESIKEELFESVLEVVQNVENKIKSLEFAINERKREDKEFPVIDASLDMPINNHNLDNKDVFGLDNFENHNINYNSNNNLNQQHLDLIHQTQDLAMKNKQDIIGLENSIRDLKKLYLDMSKKSRQTTTHEEEKVSNNENFQAAVELRFGEVERSIAKMKLMLDDTRGLEDVTENTAVKSSGEGSIKEIIKATASNLKTVTDKVDKMQIKLDHITAEILNKLKKDLAFESQRVLDEFKVDLKMSILKLDDQIKDKVDRYNFDEYGRKVDSKINSEMSKKIDKNELKRNNNIINKKIDNLETRISKTLVDTIIDLQVDEAPLIVKKGVSKDKCVSCNQVVHDSENPVMNSLNKYQDLADRYKLKSLQEITSKLGIGSFSRILSNIEPESLIEDNFSPAQTKKKLATSNNVNLPQITNYGTSITNNNLNNAIQDELDKKIVRGSNLIKSVEKLYNSSK